ncbi:MAG: hypothetical protein ACFNOL_05500, partial [Treponema maltophilum]
MGLYDARFFRGDFFNRVAEIVGVFEFDRSDAAEFRRDDVCRVEPAAQDLLPVIEARPGNTGVN